MPSVPVCSLMSRQSAALQNSTPALRLVQPAWTLCSVTRPQPPTDLPYSKVHPHLACWAHCRIAVFTSVSLSMVFGSARMEVILREYCSAWYRVRGKATASGH